MAGKGKAGGKGFLETYCKNIATFLKGAIRKLKFI
jgi:hypothetical protein